MDSSTWDDIRFKLDFARFGKPALIGMAAILVLVAVVSGYVLSGAATSSNFEVTTQDASDAALDAAAEPVHVHVAGAVNDPGVYELPASSRVADAVEAAGGFTEDAAADSCNLARVVADGEQIVIPSKDADAVTVVDGTSQPAGAAPANANSGLVNINSATVKELEALPGIGSVLAREIVSDRNANGPFSSIEDLTRVQGIGSKRLADIADLICV